MTFYPWHIHCLYQSLCLGDLSLTHTLLIPESVSGRHSIPDTYTAYTRVCVWETFYPWHIHCLYQSLCLGNILSLTHTLLIPESVSGRHSIPDTYTAYTRVCVWETFYPWHIHCLYQSLCLGDLSLTHTLLIPESVSGRHSIPNTYTAYTRVCVWETFYPWHIHCLYQSLCLGDILSLTHTLLIPESVSGRHSIPDTYTAYTRVCAWETYPWHIHCLYQSLCLGDILSLTHTLLIPESVSGKPSIPDTYTAYTRVSAWETYPWHIHCLYQSLCLGDILSLTHTLLIPESVSGRPSIAGTYTAYTRVCAWETFYP